jgi:hypothetical protein
MSQINVNKIAPQSGSQVMISGSLVADGTFNISGSVISGSELHVVGDTFIGGNLTLGDADTDTISVVAEYSGSMIPDTDSEFDLGSSTKKWKSLYVSASEGVPTVDNWTVLYNTGSGQIFYTSSAAVGGGGSGAGFPFSGSAEITGSMLLSGSDSDEPLLVVSGTMVSNVEATTSTAIYTNNIQNGYPTSNEWQSSLEGSYFNNFDNTTHVSEILRFMAGIISHSIDTSSPTANTKYYNTITTSHTEGSTTTKDSLLDGVLGSTYEDARLSQQWTSSAFIDMDETGSYRAVQDYLTLKGWLVAGDLGTFGNDTGTNPFHGTYASRIP